MGSMGSIEGNLVVFAREYLWDISVCAIFEYSKRSNPGYIT